MPFKSITQYEVECMNKKLSELEKNELTTYCKKWAVKNNIDLPQCVGEWTDKDNKCSYECLTS